MVSEARIVVSSFGGRTQLIFAGLKPHFPNGSIQLVLRGPTIAVTKQYSAALRDALVLLSSWFRDPLNDTELGIVPGGGGPFFFLSWLCSDRLSRRSLLQHNYADPEAIDAALLILSEAFLAIPKALLDGSRSTRRFVEDMNKAYTGYDEGETNFIGYLGQPSYVFDPFTQM